MSGEFQIMMLSCEDMSR